MDDVTKKKIKHLTTRKKARRFEIVQKNLQTKRTTYELLQILSASLMDKMPLKDLLTKVAGETFSMDEHPFLPGFEI